MNPVVRIGTIIGNCIVIFVCGTFVQHFSRPFRLAGIVIALFCAAGCLWNILILLAKTFAHAVHRKNPCDAVNFGMAWLANRDAGRDPRFLCYLPIGHEGDHCSVAGMWSRGRELDEATIDAQTRRMARPDGQPN